MERSLLPLAISDLIQKILDQKFELVLIGGGARAIADNLPLPFDLDFEIRFPAEYKEGEEWISFLDRSLRQAKESLHASFEQLKYGVFRLQLGEYSLEFASPRVEIFVEDNWGHSNFHASLSSHLDDSKAFARRDFTFNAFGYCFSQVSTIPTLCDPFGGAGHWKQRLMVPCGINFYRDPVRFLRGGRFSLQYSLSASSEFLSQLKQANFQQLSGFHFLKEARKVHFGHFLSLLEEWSKSHHFALPPFFSWLSPLISYDNLEYGLFMCAVKREMDQNTFDEVVQLFMLKKKKFQKLWSEASALYEKNYSDSELERLWKQQYRSLT